MTNSEPDGHIERDYIERDEVVDEPSGRARAVRTVNVLIRFICGLFATVLVLHILLVILRANMGNAFAAFIADFAGNVSLGLGNLFTIGNDRVELALNEGLAAVLWLLIGVALTAIIANVFMPELGGRILRRRRITR